MKTRRFWLVLLLLASATLSAQTIVLDYVDGTVELKTKTNTWVTVDAGAKLTADSVLRLSNNGLAEMTVGTSRLHLGKDGTYPLVNLLAQAGKKTESNLASLAGSKVDKLLSGNPTGQVQVANMGARAAEMDAGGGLDFVEEEDETTAEVPVAATPDPFVQAVAFANAGSAARSLRTLQKLDLRPTDPNYVAGLLLYVSQGLEVQDYDLVLAKADEGLRAQKNNPNPDRDVLQSLTLGQGLAYKGKGDVTQAKKAFAAVQALGAQTPLGVEAGRLGKL